MAVLPVWKVPATGPREEFWYEDVFDGTNWSAGVSGNTSTQWDTRAFQGNQIRGIRLVIEGISSATALEFDIRPNALTTNLETSGQFSNDQAAPGASGEATRWFINNVTGGAHYKADIEISTRTGVYRWHSLIYGTTTPAGVQYVIRRDGPWRDDSTEMTYVRLPRITGEFANPTRIAVYIIR